jgi:YHS domain-containing protein
MTRIITALALGAALCLGATNALARTPTPAEDPVNAMCPIGKEPIVATAGTIEYKGRTIGFCCPGCSDAFMGWEAARRDEFVTLAVAGREPGQAEHGKAMAGSPAQVELASFPYTLGTCPISGGKLGSMGDPVVEVVDGREVRFCCDACVPTFKQDPAAHWGKIDKQIVGQQLMHYPIDTCIVSGGKLGSMGDPIDHVYKNRLVRFCCAGCIPKFEADPAKYLAELDKEIIGAQRGAYPMDTCVVLGGKLGSMGEPVDHVYMNRLVRFCCAGCLPKFNADPASYMGKIDAAYADAQRDDYPIETCVVSGGKLGSMGDPVEIVAGNRLVRFCCASCVPTFAKDPSGHTAKIDGSGG